MTQETLSRRRFGLSLTAAALPATAGTAAGAQFGGPWSGPATVAKVYLTAKDSHWPKTGFDVASEVKAIDARLESVEKKHAGSIRFTGGQMLREAAEVASWAKGLAEADAVLAVPLTAPMVSLGAVASAAKLPLLCFSHPYYGHAWSGVAPLRRAGHRIEVLPTSNYDDLDAYVPVFRAIHHLRRSKVLVATNRPGFWYVAPAKEFTAQFGTAIEFLKLEELKAVYESGDAREALKEAQAFTRGALKVVEPKPREIEEAMRFYLGLRAFLRKQRANAISIDCFPAVVDRTLPAYPCLAWSKLNDEQLYGVCQADVRATMTQLLITSHSGVPGFVANPVFDAGSNEVIHSHCVAATRMLGFHEPPSPYLVRSHLETAEGAVLQVVMPVGRTVTVAQFSDAKRMLVSTAEAIGTTSEAHGGAHEEYGCRTKIRTRVADAMKWAENYETGVHRVVFYGDHTKGIERMGRMMGFRVVAEPGA